jgi:hypothetical protein
MSVTQVDPKVAAWLARLIEAIGSQHTFDAGYGDFHLGTIPITFDSDPNTGLAIGWSDTGDLAIIVGSMSEHATTETDQHEEQG